MAGLLGGGLGHTLLSMVGALDLAGAVGATGIIGGIDLGRMIGHSVCGGDGGGALLAIFAMIRKTLAK
ncbi:hypothetical protein NBRC116601_22450 [Cognatishimia sp. WU-CL00825]